MRVSSKTALAVGVALVLAGATAWAQTIDEQADFKKGRYAYVSKSYDDADALFRRMLDPVSGTLHDKVLVNEARMYWGATLIAKGRKDDAIREFEALLDSDPNYEPDATVFPLAVGEVFIDAQANNKKKRIAAEQAAKLREEQRREAEEAARKAQIERLRQLEKLASEEHVTDKHSRWIAILPFGVGQFQNGSRPLGWFFLATESLELAGSLVAVGDYLYQLHEANAAYTSVSAQDIAQQYLDRANEARVANLVFNGALALTAVAGALEAEASYVPQFQVVKPRPLPPLPGTSPDGGKPAGLLPPVTFGASPLFGEGRGVTGGMVGVTGRF